MGAKGESLSSEQLPGLGQALAAAFPPATGASSFSPQQGSSALSWAPSSAWLPRGLRVCSAPSHKGWTRWPPEISSNLSYLVILPYTCCQILTPKNDRVIRVYQWALQCLCTMSIHSGKGKEQEEETEKVKNSPSLLTNRRILEKINILKENICSVTLRYFHNISWSYLTMFQQRR